MILQSITKAIREQNYYAVALEFVIVIAGVVIGFQINAWNSERESAARAATLIERLGQETAAAFESHERDLGRLAQRNQELSLFNTVLSPQSEMDGSEALCGLIDQSHLIFWSGVRIPVLDEIAETGSLALISDTEVREAIVDLNTTIASMSDRIEILRNTENILRLEFPDLVRVVPVGANEVRPNRWPVACDWKTMRGSASVFNMVANNFDRQGALQHLYAVEISAMRQLLEILQKSPR